jgi:putative transposase
MANTYTQLHIQFIFAVKYRAAMIQSSWKESLHKFITGIFQKNKHKMLQVNSMPEHIHILIGLHPEQSISSIIQNVKTESSKWINNQKLTPGKFGWQDARLNDAVGQGYRAFSYSKSHLSRVIRYIQQQEQHHRKQTFMQEYKSFLEAFGIEYDDRYIFSEPI